MFLLAVHCSEDVGIVLDGSQSCHSNTYIPHTHSKDWEKLLHPQTHGFQKSNLESMQKGKHIKTFGSWLMTVSFVRLCTWAFRAALSRWCVWVCTVEWRTWSSLTGHTAMLWRREVWRWTIQCDVVWCVLKRRHGHLTDADVTGLVRAHKPLAVAVDTMVEGAAFTHCTTGT